MHEVNREREYTMSMSRTLVPVSSVATRQPRSDVRNSP